MLNRKSLYRVIFLRPNIKTFFFGGGEGTLNKFMSGAFVNKFILEANVKQLILGTTVYKFILKSLCNLFHTNKLISKSTITTFILE